MKFPSAHKTGALIILMLSFPGCLHQAGKQYHHLFNSLYKTQVAGKEPIQQLTTNSKINIREEPNTSSKVVRSVPKGTLLGLVARQDKWLMVISMDKGSPYSGYVRGDLVSAVTPYQGLPGSHIKSIAANENLHGQKISSSHHRKYASGYSLTFDPVRNTLLTNKPSEYLTTIDYLLPTRKDDRDSIQYLSSLERGMILLGAGETSSAASNLKSAEEMLISKEDRSISREYYEKYGSDFIAFISGNQNLKEYEGEDFEKILTLNLSSLAQLLQGNRAAYNIARRSIDFQNEAYEKFLVRKTQIEIEIENRKTSVKSSNNQLNLFTVTDHIDSLYEEYEKDLPNLPHSYVNPFGYYLSGVIQEIESAEDSSLLDNARISYEKAASLSPQNKLFNTAIKETSRARKSGTRIMHLIAAVGFVPDKKVLEFDLQLPLFQNSSQIPIRLPIWDPIADPAGFVEIHDSSGKLLTRSTVVSDISSIVLRNQKDKLPAIKLHVITGLTKTVATNSALSVGSIIAEAKTAGISQIIGAAFRNAPTIDLGGEPDTRAWLSLPRQIQAARASIKPNSNNVRVVLKSTNGKTLNQQNVAISTEGDAVLFVRSYGNTLHAISSKKLWSTEDR